MIPEDIFLKIVRCATKAPSGHNTQPWLFSKNEDVVYIIPDFKRALPVADPQNRELFISLGCVVENAKIAARFYGYSTKINVDLLSNRLMIRIALQKDDCQEQPELFSYIKYRQTTRNFYDDTAIPDEDIVTLIRSLTIPPQNLMLYTNYEQKRTLTPFILNASRIQMTNPAFTNELIYWMRFSQREAMQKGDGLYTACFGLPSMGRTLGSFVLKKCITSKTEEKRLRKEMSKAATIALITSEKDDPEHWVETGCSFQRFALTATSLNLNHSYLNSPIQVPEMRAKLMSEMSLDGAYPQLLIRLGYSNKTSFSFRRRVNDMIIK